MANLVEQILATLSIDSVNVGVVTDRIILTQRDPQPMESDISVNTTIKMVVIDMLVDPEGTITDPSFIFLVNGQQVASYAGGTFTPVLPWSGSMTFPDSDDPYTSWNIELIPPPGLFESEDVVNVAVQTNVGTGYGHNGPWGHFLYGHAINGGYTEISYDFQIEDLTPPRLLSAEAIDAFTVRVTFDEPMAVDGTGSLLNIDNWAETITRHNVDPLPGVNLDVVSVEFLDGSNNTVVDLTVNWEMTQGCLYRLTASSIISDDSENQIDQSYRVAEFIGFQFAAVPRRYFDHWTMMIPLKNRQEDLTRDLQRFSNCIAETLGLLLSDIDRFSDQFDPDLATNEQIDAMLFDMGNPFVWPELVLTADERRNLLRVLIEIYRLKGTAIGIESTVQFILGENVKVVPYLEEGWVLGIDELGTGSIAEVMSDNGEPFNFLSDATLVVELDGYFDINANSAKQTILFDPTKFTTPSAGRASEVVDIINDQIIGGGAYITGAGLPARLKITGSPFLISAGDTLQLRINGVSKTVVFRSYDFADISGATAEEIARRVAIDVDSVKSSFSETELEIETLHTGEDSEIFVSGGTAIAALGLSVGDVANGTDAQRIVIFSETAGIGAWVKISGGNAADIIGFKNNISGGTGGSVLAPEEQYQIYSFDIVTNEELDESTKAIVRLIAEYMKVAHEHLINIRTAATLPRPDGWVLGVDYLDESAELSE